jgi:hypothetical protein
LLSKSAFQFDVNTKTTDIIMFNSRNLGALIVDEKPHVNSWDDPQYSILNLGIEESYGFGVLNEGQVIAIAKNIYIRERDVDTGGARSSRSRQLTRSWSTPQVCSAVLRSTSTRIVTTSPARTSSANY